MIKHPILTIIDGWMLLVMIPPIRERAKFGGRMNLAKRNAIILCGKTLLSIFLMCHREDSRKKNSRISLVQKGIIFSGEDMAGCEEIHDLSMDTPEEGLLQKDESTSVDHES